jgi:hypothetical protein
VSLLETQTGETERGLPSSPVLLGQVHSELVQHLSRVPLQSAVKTTITIHHDKTKLIIILEQLIECFSVKLIVAQVQRGIDWFEGLEIDIYALFLAIISQDRPTIKHKTIVGDARVKL